MVRRLNKSVGDHGRVNKWVIAAADIKHIGPRLELVMNVLRLISKATLVRRVRRPKKVT